MDSGEGLKERVTRQSEETIGRFAQELLENPVVSGALSRAFETRERAVRAQEVAMSALNLPSASDLERLTRRVRSVSQRLEGIEDGLDRLDERLRRPAVDASLDERLRNIERALERLEAAHAPAGSTPAPAAPADTATPPPAPADAATPPAPSPAAGAAKRTASRRTSARAAGKRAPGPGPGSSS